MSQPNLSYDELSDTLYISFVLGEKATGIELNDSILLRINKQERRAVGITIFNYSYLAQKTPTGFRSLPLTGLDELSPALRELALDLLTQPPVSEFLTISTYAPSLTENIPITSLQQAFALAS